MQSYILHSITVNNLLLSPTIINTHNITSYIHITTENFTASPSKVNIYKIKNNISYANNQQFMPRDLTFYTHVQFLIQQYTKIETA
jgi:hypothetical protein